MRQARAFFVRLINLFRRRRSEEVIAAEIQSNLELHIEEGVRRGLSPEEARRQSLMSLGGVEVAKEAWRDRNGIPFLDAVWKDVTYAFRMLGRSKAWTAVAILSLALGIGANTALYSVLNGLLLQKLPVPSPDELVAFRWVGENSFSVASSNYGYVAGMDGQRASASFTLPTYEAFRKANETLNSVFVFVQGPTVSMVVDGIADIASSQLVSGNYYLGLGVPVVQGRGLTTDDDRTDAEFAVVISHEYWNRRFGRDPAALGKTVTINGNAASIVGIEAAGLGDMRRVGAPSKDVSIPLGMESRITPEGQRRADQPWAWSLPILGRLKAATTLAQVEANFAGVFEESAREALASWASTARPEALQMVMERPEQMPRLRVVPASRGLYDVPQSATSSLAVLAAVFGVVLLVVCVNLANLQLSRIEARQQEISARLAIGASRGRLVRQLLTESVVLAALGGIAGLAVAYAGRNLLSEFTAANVADGMNWTVLVFAAAVTTVTGMLFGLGPALRSSRVDLTATMRGAGRFGRSRSRVGKALVVAQVALSLALLVGAGLFLRTLINLQGTDTGFDSENLALFRIDPQFARYDAVHTRAVYERILERLHEVPGVRAASYSNHALLARAFFGTTLAIEGQENSHAVVRMSVDHRFFGTMGMPILLGRAFHTGDAEGRTPVAVINDRAARTLFADSNPIGRRFNFLNDPENIIEVVGVVVDTKYANIREDTPLLVFTSYAQDTRPAAVTFLARTTTAPEAVFQTIRDAMREVAPELPVMNLTTQREMEAAQWLQERMFASASAIFSALAVAIAAVGLFGVMSYAVSRRTKEIGVRMALGAGRGAVLGAVLRESLLLAFIGVILGVAVSLGATRLLTGMLFGLAPNDPPTIVSAALLMLIVAAAAGYLPARRASRVDPMIALRHD